MKDSLIRFLSSFSHSRRKNHQRGRSRDARVEKLESRELLAITWANEFGTGVNDPAFSIYGVHESVARLTVNRAIADWNAVITDFDFDNDNNPLTNNFQLFVFAANLGGPNRGKAQITEVTHGGTGQSGWTPGIPKVGKVTLDDNGGSSGWFFDQTPLDDIEFTAIGDVFQSSFIDASTLGQQRVNDIYRTVLHEIGHALGIGLVSDLSSGNFTATYTNSPSNPTSFTPVGSVVSQAMQDILLGSLQYVGRDQAYGSSGLRIVANPDNSLTVNGDETAVIDELWRYTFQSNPSRSVTFTEDGGGHLYEGPLNGNTPNASQHPNELMNSGRTVPPFGANPVPVTRQFISDLSVEFLADAFGYSVVLPSTLNNAHVMLDPQTGTLLVQGRPRTSAGAGQNETIDVAVSGSDIVVTVTYNSKSFVERVPAAQVRDIVIHKNGGTDSVNIGTGVYASSRTVNYVDHVVSSNQDAIETSTSVGQNTPDNGIVDLDPIVPGNQTTLRAAIVEANATPEGQAIYIGRGHYKLTRAQSGQNDDALSGDLDITTSMTLFGAGAGVTVIDAGGMGGLGDRVFEVKSGGMFSARQLTISGGYTTGHGGGILLSALTLAGVSIPNSASASLFEVAVVDNYAAGFAGGIAGYDVPLTVNNSVIARNSVGGSAVWHAGGLNVGNVGSLTLIGSTFALNTAPGTSTHADLVRPPAGLTYTYNRIQSSNLIPDPNQYMVHHNWKGNPHFVVTTINDTVDSTNDNRELSLREAVLKANDQAGTDEIWLPGWRMSLSRAALSGGESGTPDNWALYGDLDISQSIYIRGIENRTKIGILSPAVADRVFDLVGDTNRSMTPASASTSWWDVWSVSLGDYTVWRDNVGGNDPGADVDDDGDVDSDDYDIWSDHFNNQMCLVHIEGFDGSILA